MSVRLLPPLPSRPVQGLPIPFRRHAAEDDGYAAALLAGCVIGIMLAWPMVLSESARARLLGAVAAYPPVTAVVAASGSGRPAPAAFAAAATAGSGMPARDERPQQYVLAKWPAPAVGSAGGSAARAAMPARPVAQPLPERLMLPEEVEPPLPAPAPAVAETPAVELEIVFDINSSFLPPGAVAALEDVLGRLPVGGSASLALQASVSDDGVRGGRAGEAQRYNRWLAERRLERVAAWLREHARLDLAIEPGFREHDPSRRVLLSTRQLP
jgi:hypothetical protein